MKNVFLFLTFFLIINSELLLIVGDVTTTTARVLYEGPKNEKISVRLFSHEVSMVKEEVIEVEMKPKVIKFNNLPSNTNFVVQFGTDSVKFKTLPNQVSNQPLKIVVVSCNRFFEDKDDSLWKELSENEHDRIGMVHLGDQIYADIIGKEYYMKSYDEILEEFRNIYRKSWSSPYITKVLRSGFHWMMPDDHDIINNLDEHFIESPLKNVILAGRQAFYEYQYQLFGDLDMLKNDEIYFFKNISNYGLAVMDFRFSRTFQYDKKNPLLGEKQYELLKSHVHLWNQSKDIEKILIFSAIPFPIMTELAANIVYIAEKEKYMPHPELVDYTVDLLNFLKPYHSKVRLIAGDAHHFAFTKLCDIDNVCLNQMVTSGITVKSTVIDSLKIYTFTTLLNWFDKRSVKNWKMKYDLQYLDKNYGVLTLDKEFEWKGVFQNQPLFNQIMQRIFLLNWNERIFILLIIIYYFRVRQ